MINAILEAFSAAIIAVVAVILYRIGRRRRDLPQKGWRLLLLGFLLLLMAGLVDITDEFESLNRFLIFGETAGQAFLEKVVGYSGGLLLIALGFRHWIPTIVGSASLKQYASALETANSALREATADAEAATRAKSEFLANMSHEIRTPMTAILGFAEILLGEGNLKDAPPERVEALKTIHRNGQFLLDLINDILDLSKVEAGKANFQLESCSLLEILSDVVSLVRVRADAKRLPLEAELDGPLPKKIFTDPRRLRQILINLMGNAVKFTEIGSVRLKVRLAADSPEPHLEFRVIDTGIGIPEDKVDSIFEPFTQGDGSTSRRFGGTGLGLTISKRLAQQLGGDITVTSRLGKGSTFCLSINPGSLEGTAMVHANWEEFSRSRLEVRTQQEKIALDCRILLAEDGPDNQRLISFLLRKAGAEVEVAANGLVAVEEATAAREAGRPFDVILMDMQMPVMDGCEATRQLRARGYRGPIIALTANAMIGDREKCLRAGCDEFATKPIEKRSLLETIARRLAAQPAERDSVC